MQVCTVTVGSVNITDTEVIGKSSLVFPGAQYREYSEAALQERQLAGATSGTAAKGLEGL